MNARAKTERRQHPRIDKELPVKIAANGYDFASLTQNVSCLGAYCRIDKYIPPFTKVAVRLTLPMRDNRQQAKKYDVECKGVIVRAEDDSNSGFNIAIFFNDIKGSQRQKISRYISQFLP